MKKLIIVTAILIGTAAASQAAVSVSIGIGFPSVRVAAPVVCAPPVIVPPVVCHPPVVYSAPPRVVYAPPTRVVYAPYPGFVYAGPPVACAPRQVVVRPAYWGPPRVATGFYVRGHGHARACR